MNTLNQVATDFNYVTFQEAKKIDPSFYISDSDLNRLETFKPLPGAENGLFLKLETYENKTYPVRGSLTHLATDGINLFIVRREDKKLMLAPEYTYFKQYHRIGTREEFEIKQPQRFTEENATDKKVKKWLEYCNEYVNHIDTEINKHALKLEELKKEYAELKQKLKAKAKTHHEGMNNDRFYIDAFRINIKLDVSTLFIEKRAEIVETQSKLVDTIANS